MKTIETGNVVNRKELEKLLQFPESVAIVENGQQVMLISESEMQTLTSNFSDYQVNVELDCIENGEEPIKLDFIEYFLNKFGYSINKDNYVGVIEF